MARMYGGSAHIFGISFSRQDEDLAVVGVKTVRFYSGIMSKSPTCSRPTLGSVGSMQPFICVTYFTGNPVVGTRDGNIYMFVDNALKTTVKAHDGSVNTIDVDGQGTSLVTGGKDGAVRIWNVHLECTKEITVSGVYPQSGNPTVKAVCFSADGNNLLIGTRGVEILEVAVRSGTIVGGPYCMDTVCENSGDLPRIRPRAVHPSGDDNKAIWDKNFTGRPCALTWRVGQFVTP